MSAGRWCAVLAMIALGCGSEEAPGAGGTAASSGAGASGGAAGAAGVSGVGGASGASGAGGSGGSGGSGECDVSVIAGLVVQDADLDAFPPYAIDGCQLLYVAESGDLLLRDLEAGSEATIAPASAAPRRPTIAGATLAWEAQEAGERVVVVSQSGTNTTVSGPFDHAGEPRATADAVVFTAWLGAAEDSDTDVYVFDLSSKSAALVGGGPKQQRFADISATHVAYTDLTEDPIGSYSGDGISLADIVLVDRASGLSTAIPRPGKQAFPMLGASDVLGYLEWITVHPVPKLQEYTIWSVPLSSPTTAPTAVGAVQSEARVRPTAQGELFEWVVRWQGAVTLHRAPADGSSEPSAVSLTAFDLHAPVASETTTVIAVRPSAGAAPELRTIPR